MNLNLPFTAKQSKFNNLEVYEPVSRELLEKLINSSLLKKTFNNKLSKKYFNHEFQQLKEYLSHKTNDEEILKIKVKYTQSIPYGRVNPEKSLGLHSLRREVRHTIARDYLTDIDIKSCHYFIAEQLCKNIDDSIDLSAIEEYNKDPTKYREELQKTYKCDKDTAKSLLLALLNGGGEEQWAEKNKIDKSIKLPKKVQILKNQCRTIGEVIYNNMSDSLINLISTKKQTNEQYKIKKACIAYTLQHYENLILEVIHNYCLENKIISDCYVLSNDGIMIPTENYNDSLLNEFSNEVYNKTGFKIKFENKPLDQGYSLEEIEKAKYYHVNIDDINSHKDYAKIVHFYNPSLYVYCEFSGWYEKNINGYYEHKEQIPSNLYWSIGDTISKVFNKISLELEEDKQLIKNEIKKNKNNENLNIEELNNKINSINLQLKQIKKIISNSGSSNFCSGICKFLEEKYKNNNFFNIVDTNNKCICFNNIIYDFEISKFRKVKHNDYFSKTTGYNIPLDKNLKPIRNESAFKTLTKFFNSLFEDSYNETSEKILCEDANYLLTTMSRALCYNNDQTGYFWTGRGGNGKSLCAELLRIAYGDYYKTLASNYMTHINKNPTAPDAVKRSLPHNKILMTSEPEGESNDGGCKLNTALFKSLTGSDTITARGLFEKKETTFTLSSTFIMLCNDLPNLKEVNDAMTRRIRVINFPFCFKENPTLLNHKLINKSLMHDLTRPEVIAEFMFMMIDNCEKMRGKNIETTKSVIENSKIYFDNNDPIYSYINGFLKKNNNENEYIKISSIYEHYKKVSDMPTTSSKFTNLLFNKITEFKELGDYYHVNKLKEFGTVNGYKVIRGVSVEGYKVFYSKSDPSLNATLEKIEDLSNDFNINDF